MSGVPSGAHAREGKRKTYAEGLEQVLGLLVHVELAALGVLGEVEGGDLGDVLILALALLLLQLEGDAADGAALDALHQMGGVAGNLRGASQRFEFLFTIVARTRCPGSGGKGDGSTLLRRRLEAMMAISSQTRLLVSKSRVSLG